MSPSPFTRTVCLVTPLPCPSSLPERSFTPDSPINYHHVAEGVEHIDTPPVEPSEEEDPVPEPSQENDPLAAPLYHIPDCINQVDVHLHQFIVVQTPQGEEWRPISEFYQLNICAFPIASSLVVNPPHFPGVTPFQFASPHYTTIYPRDYALAIQVGVQPLVACSQAVLNQPSADLPLGCIKYNFHGGL